MKRTVCSLLALFCLLVGAVQPVAAAQETQPTSEISEASEQVTESAEQPSEETEELPAEPTEAPAEPTEPLTEPTERPQTRAPEKMKVSEQGVAFIGEMMSGAVGPNQLSAAEQAVNDFASRYDLSLTQTQYDALADLVTAYGSYILTSGYQVERVIADGSYSDAQLASAFCAWVKSGNDVSQQHLARRLREIKLFLYGSYDGNCEANFRYVVFNANGGALTDNSVLCYAYDLPYGTLPGATRANSYFDGWYTASSGGTKLTETDTASENRTLYAHWTTEPSDSQFSDVASGSWYYTYVTQAAAKGLFNGVGDGKFDPNGFTTRAMLTTVLWRQDGKKEAATAPFTDVPSEKWYAAAIDWAFETGVVKGVSETLFGPDEEITREQLVTMLYRYAQTQESFDTTATAELSAFSDADTVSAYAAEAIRWAVAVKIMNGDGGRLRPQGNATRAECAKLLLCFTALSGGGDDPSDDPKPLPDPPKLRISEDGIQFIKDHEGFIKYAMWDYAQWSIGYGTRCEKDEFPDGITEEEADYRLRFMLADFEKSLDALEKRFGREFSQQEYDALLSFTFNLGAGWMSRTDTMTYKMLYSNTFTEMEFVNTLGLWINAGGQPLNGLAQRRMDEANLYLHGEYLRGCTRYLRLTYNANEGSCDTKYYYYMTDQPLGELPVPTREGYTFVGWYDRLNGGEQYTAETIAPAYGNYTLYARWEQ